MSCSFWLIRKRKAAKLRAERMAAEEEKAVEVVSEEEKAVEKAEPAEKKPAKKAVKADNDQKSD